MFDLEFSGGCQRLNLATTTLRLRLPTVLHGSVGLALPCCWRFCFFFLSFQGVSRRSEGHQSFEFLCSPARLGGRRAAGAVAGPSTLVPRAGAAPGPAAPAVTTGGAGDNPTGPGSAADTNPFINRRAARSAAVFV